MRDGRTHRPPYVVAGWRFDPAEPRLRAGDRERRLEDRAARTLDLLCRRRGEVVSKEELIAEVWDGRTVSTNSVSIVIGSLRRALDDDPREPVHLLTVARRGYRLVAEPAEPEAPPSAAPIPGRGRTGAWRAGAAGLLAVAVAAMVLRPGGGPVTMRVEPPVNATGQPGLAPLAASLAPVVVDGADRLGHVRVMDGAASDGARIVLRSRLILWNGAPELALSATDTRSQAVIWTGFAAGPPAELARHVTARVQDVATHLPP